MLLKKLTSNAPHRYLAVAICGFSLDFLVFAALVSWKCSVYMANVAGFFMGAVVNVVLIRRFVFKSSRFKLHQDIGLSFLANGAMLLLGNVMLWLLVGFLNFNPYGSKIAVNGITFVLNYATRATFFRRR